MEQLEVKELLEQVAKGEKTVDEALLDIRIEPFKDIGIAKIDTHRGVRQGVSEVIYGASKTPEQIKTIAEKLYESGQKTVLITRMSREAADYMGKDLPFTYHEISKVGIVGGLPKPVNDGYVLIICAGTSDLPVAEEAALTAQALGSRVITVNDAGVSGLHRILSHAEDIAKADAIVAIAGMEGALPSVIGGIADCPVIGVPTSVGYGASLGGVTALLAMLNSCASGVSVVNIDNGFGAGYQAHLINRRCK